MAAQEIREFRVRKIATDKPDVDITWYGPSTDGVKMAEFAARHQALADKHETGTRYTVETRTVTTTDWEHLA